MWDSGWCAMRINRFCRQVVVVVALTVPAGGASADENERRDRNTEPDDTVLPEHRPRPLPTDTFKPSEDISEDFAVPFPVDI